MTIAVVGGSGFIGSHVIERLLTAGYSVTDFDIMPPGFPSVRHIYVDIINTSRTVIALAGEHEAVYLLAAMANVGDVYKSPIEAVEVNVAGTCNVLEAARRHDIPRVILASTVWVYSAATTSTCNEDSPLVPAKIDHVYTATKVASEMLTQSYAKLYGLNFTILRYGIPYGPRARSGTVIAEFVKRALRSQPILIQGDGKQKRRFIYVEDLADANVKALSEKARNKTYNVDGPEEVSILQIAEKVNSILGPVEIKFTEARPGDYTLRTAPVDRIAGDLGWKPSTSFDVGLRKYIDWYKSEKKNAMS